MAFAEVGKVAPAFSLLDQRGNKVSLKQFRTARMWCFILPQSNDTRLHRASLWHSGLARRELKRWIRGGTGGKP